MLGAPTPPSGFVTNLNYDTSVRLNPLAVYVCAISGMYKFGLFKWHEELATDYVLWAQGYNAEIEILPGLGALHLQVSHVIFGLYETMVEIATHSQFCRVTATLSLHGRQIGRLAIQENAHSTLGTSGSNATNSTILSLSSQSNLATYPSGEIIDHEDPEFSIVYTFTGTHINSRDIFLVVLDALATTAPFSLEEQFVSLHEVSPSGSCEISIVGFPGPFGPNYSFAVKALRNLVMDLIVVLRKFEEMTFELRWENVHKMAEGSIRLVSSGAAAQKEQTF